MDSSSRRGCHLKVCPKGMFGICVCLCNYYLCVLLGSLLASSSCFLSSFLYVTCLSYPWVSRCLPRDSKETIEYNVIVFFSFFSSFIFLSSCPHFEQLSSNEPLLKQLNPQATMLRKSKMKRRNTEPVLPTSMDRPTLVAPDKPSISEEKQS